MELGPGAGLLICFGILFLLCMVFLYSAVDTSSKRIKQREKAQEQYQQALLALRNDPGNVELRQATLTLGRRYCEVASHDKRNLFDEVALMNDLNAIPVGTATIYSSEMVSDSSTLNSRLQKLDELYELGAITKEERETRRNGILNEI